MTEDNRPIAIVSFDRHGNMNVMHESGVRVFCIDDRSPNDRVYEMTIPTDRAVLVSFLEGQEIGSRFDHRHAAISNRILSEMDGTSRFTLVDDDGDKT